MKAPTFWHGVLAAAVLAFCASAMMVTLTPFLGPLIVLRLAIPLLAAAYLLFFFRGVAQRTGRVVTFSLWTALAVCTWWAGPPLPLYLLIHAGAVWMIRSLYAYEGVFPALLDLGLCALSVLAFGWVFARTGGIFLATWSFFLVQALWIAIPPKIGASAAGTRTPAGNERFERAQRQADEALRQLFSR